MARSPVPSYRLHKQSGQGIVTLADSLGRRRDVLLGPYDTDSSRAEYARVIGEWEASGRQLIRMLKRRPSDEDASLSIGELLLGYISHVETYYRHPDGQ